MDGRREPADRNLRALGLVGNVNGDGYSDVAVGGYLFDGQVTNSGRVDVFLGSAAGLETLPSWTTEADQSDSFYGWRVADAGDVNSDGYDDLVVGVRNLTNGEFLEGGMTLYLGSAVGLDTTPALNFESNEVDTFFGDQLSAAGNVDGDGYDNIMVGSQNARGDQGRVFVMRGSAAGLEPFPASIIEPPPGDDIHSLGPPSLPRGTSTATGMVISRQGPREAVSLSCTSARRLAPRPCLCSRPSWASPPLRVRRCQWRRVCRRCGGLLHERVGQRRAAAPVPEPVRRRHRGQRQ